VHELPIYEIFIDGKPNKIDLKRIEDCSFEIEMNDREFKVNLKTDMLGKESFSINIDDEIYNVHIPKINREKCFSINVEGVLFQAEVKIPKNREVSTFSRLIPIKPARRDKALKQVSEGSVTAPMTGRILSVMVEEGDLVKTGQVLCVLEAMKMENEITASKAGTIKKVFVSEGSPVSEGEVLFIVG
jgi:biotin carboxyl carrier protein